MSDIRINALATTATASASDDYVAIDGSANGTRKLSAYSPTFGGNLTVSGNGVFGSSSGATAAQLNAWNDQAAPTRLLLSNQTNNASSLVGIDFEAYGGGWQVDVPRSTTFVNPLVFKFNFSEQARFTSGGTLLLKTDGIDSSNGRLQLATHTTSAGGIGFGTDVSVYRNAAGSLVTDYVGGSSPAFSLSANGTVQSRFFSNGSNTFLESYTNTPLILRTNQTTALTLDSSQQALFASKIVSSSNVAIGASVNDSSITLIQAGLSTGVNSKILLRDSWNGSNNNNAYFAVQLGDGSTTSDALRIDYQKNATFAGDGKIGADYTVAQKKLEIIGGSYADGQTLRLADYSTAYGFDIVNDGVNAKLKVIRHSNSVGGTEAMSIDRDTGNATFASAIAIGNTVNTVSPTSPNRTITMVIGGTTYYIHAKTTND